MNYEFIFIKGSRDPSYPLKIEVRCTPNLPLFQFDFIPHLDIFLFEMQNVTAACSTILFKLLIITLLHIKYEQRNTVTNIRIYTSPGQAIIMAMQDKRNTT